MLAGFVVGLGIIFDKPKGIEKCRVTMRGRVFVVVSK